MIFASLVTSIIARFRAARPYRRNAADRDPHDDRGGPRRIR
jgi:hypothetical protein